MSVNDRRGTVRPSSVWIGGSLIVLLAVAALGAPWLAPYGPDAQVDPAISSARPPLSTLLEVETVDGRVLVGEELVRDDDAIVLERRGHQLSLPSASIARIGVRRHLLGTDRLGRDVLSRLLFAARTSLAVGVLSAVLALGLGVAIGALAASGRPLLDELLMRLVDGLLAFPSLLIVLMMALLFEPSTLALIAVIGGTGWMGLSRLVRAELRTLRLSPFVLAARAEGAGPLRVLARHLLPNAWPPVAVAGTLLVGDAILVESAVAFLGLGLGSDLPSWGQMVAHASNDLIELWWMSLFPGVAILLTVLGFNLIGDGLRDALDPRLRYGLAR